MLILEIRYGPGRIVARLRNAAEAVPQSLGWDCTFASLDVIRIAGGHLDLVVEPYLATNRPLIEKAVAQTYAVAKSRKREARS